MFNEYHYKKNKPHKPFKFGFIIGRFQHLHQGHVEMIKTGLLACENLLLMVGSSQESGTERNPFNLKTRMDIVRESFIDEIADNRLLLGHIDDMTHEDDHSNEWGKYVLDRVDMWRQHYGLDSKLDCLIYGNDEERMSWYDPKEVEGVGQIILARSVNPISATKMREHLVYNERHEWFQQAPFQLTTDGWFDRLREELLDVKYYQEL